jgi:hypothetical protein
MCNPEQSTPGRGSRQLRLLCQKSQAAPPAPWLSWSVLTARGIVSGPQQSLLTQCTRCLCMALVRAAVCAPPPACLHELAGIGCDAWTAACMHARNWCSTNELPGTHQTWCAFLATFLDDVVGARDSDQGRGAKRHQEAPAAAFNYLNDSQLL